MSRFGRVGDLIRAELRQPAPASFSIWHILSGLILFLVLVEIISGILLMVYYRPSADEAYASVRYIMNSVQLGWLIRGIHKWGADFLVLLLVVHLARVYVQRAYHERALNWGMGILLLLLTGAFAFTGALLVWDQSAFWSTDASRRMIQSVPVLGKLVLNLLWGGEELEAGALLRFYVFHVGLLPWFTMALLMVHLYFVNRQGLFVKSAHRPARLSHSHVARDYADVLLEGLLIALFLFGVILTLTVLFTPALGGPVNSLVPIPAKTAWYFLPFYGLLKLIAGSWGLVVLGLGVIALFFIPLLERITGESPKWVTPVFGFFVLAVLVLLGVWGYWQGGLP